MVISASLLVAASDNVNASSYVTASITPPANQLILAFIGSDNETGSPGQVPTISGNGLTYVQVATAPYAGTIGKRITLFRAMGASPSAGAVTIDFAGVVQNSGDWHIIAFDGVDTGGTNGSAAVVQSATVAEGAAATSITVTLAAFGSAENATFGCVAHRANEGTAPGTGFTELADTAHTADSTGHQSEWRVDNDTTVDASWVTSAVNAGIAVEIKAAAAAATDPGLLHYNAPPNQLTQRIPHMVPF